MTIEEQRLRVTDDCDFYINPDGSVVVLVDRYMSDPISDYDLAELTRALMKLCRGRNLI